MNKKSARKIYAFCFNRDRYTLKDSVDFLNMYTITPIKKPYIGSTVIRHNIRPRDWSKRLKPHFLTKGVILLLQ
jgi:hypothetical protein